ncbi:TPA: hypothetical protein ACNFRT_002217 [Citrobacter freundii]
MSAARPYAGKHASLHETVCASTCGLDALIARRMGGNVVAERCAKTPNVNGGTPSPATRDHPL